MTNYDDDSPFEEVGKLERPEEVWTKTNDLVKVKIERLRRPSIVVDSPPESDDESFLGTIFCSNGRYGQTYDEVMAQPGEVYRGIDFADYDDAEVEESLEELNEPSGPPVPHFATGKKTRLLSRRHSASPHRPKLRALTDNKENTPGKRELPAAIVVPLPP